MILWVALLGCPPVPTEDDSSAVTDSPAATGAFTWPDPLSTPVTPTVSLSDFNSAETCVDCHPSHVAEWRTSAHSWAMTDPLFRALVAVRQTDLGGEQDAFCTQCHSNIGTRAGDVSPGFSFDVLDPLTLEGVTCEACHKVTEVARTYNSGHVLDPSGPLHGGISDPAAGAPHASASTDLLASAEFCAACHDVTEVDGLDLERPYQEWQQTPAAAEGRPCQSCHLPVVAEPAAVGGPDRQRHRHGFVGVDLPLQADLLDDSAEETLRAEIQTLLDSSATVDLGLPGEFVAGDQLDLRVNVTNNIDAHSFPTGTTFIRQCWLEVSVEDEGGLVVFSSGELDSNGDLKNHWSSVDPYGDPNLVSLGSGFIDEYGDPTLFTHLAAEHQSNALPALYTRTFTYFVDVPAEVTGDLTVSVRLRFRPVGPFLLRALGLEESLDQVPTYDVDVVQGRVPAG